MYPSQLLDIRQLSTGTRESVVSRSRAACGAACGVTIRSISTLSPGNLLLDTEILKGLKLSHLKWNYIIYIKGHSSMPTFKYFTFKLISRYVKSRHLKLRWLGENTRDVIWKCTLKGCLNKYYISLSVEIQRKWTDVIVINSIKAIDSPIAIEYKWEQIYLFHITVTFAAETRGQN